MKWSACTAEPVVDEGQPGRAEGSFMEGECAVTIEQECRPAADRRSLCRREERGFLNVARSITGAAVVEDHQHHEHMATNAVLAETPPQTTCAGPIRAQ